MHGAIQTVTRFTRFIEFTGFTRFTGFARFIVFLGFRRTPRTLRTPRKQVTIRSLIEGAAYARHPARTHSFPWSVVRIGACRAGAQRIGPAALCAPSEGHRRRIRRPAAAHSDGEPVTPDD